MKRATVGVFPGGAIRRHASLYDALGTAFDVTFVDGEVHRGSIAGAVCVGAGPVPPRIPTLVVPTDDSPSHREAAVRLNHDPAVDTRLRGLALPELGAADTKPLAMLAGCRVLATGPTGPLWITDGRGVTWSATALPHLDGAERLKTHLRSGRFLALTAIVHLMRTVTGYADWVRPANRASMTIDDPNLRRGSYGFLGFGALDDHARRFGYHVDIATVPADAGFAHEPTAALFRRSEHLSLVVHGNNHLQGELMEADARRALAIAAQSVRRIAAFETRNRLRVGRVMVPPHSVCSQTAMDALRRVGFEAMSYRGPRDHDALTGWLPADLHLGGGLAGLHRVTLGCSSGELALRSFLDQPLVLCGHHDDLAGGFSELESAVEHVGTLGAPTWMSLQDIARSNYWHRVSGSTLHIRMHTRRAIVPVPDEIEHVVVEPLADGAEPILRATTEGSLDVVVPPSNPMSPHSFSSPPWRPWPIARRIAVEGRDRLIPLMARARPRRVA